VSRTSVWKSLGQSMISRSELHTASRWAGWLIPWNARSINSSPVMNTKSTSGQASLDNPSPNNIGSSSQGTDLPVEDLPIRPWPKRAKPRSMPYPIHHSRRDVNDHAGYRCCGFVLALVLGLVWYTGAKWANSRNGAEYGRQW
jgi:hypothetical protein